MENIVDILYAMFIETGLWIRLVLSVVPFILWGIGVPVGAVIFVAYVLGGISVELRLNS